MKPANETELLDAASNRPGQFATHQVGRMILYALTWLVALAWADAARRTIERYLPAGEKVKAAWIFATSATVLAVVLTIAIGRFGIVRKV